MSEAFKNLRILKIRCKNHYLFGDMEFDFTNNGKPVDTVIIAGENGAGKSTLLDIIFNLTGGYSDLDFSEYEADIYFDDQITTYKMQVHSKHGRSMQWEPNIGINRLVSIFSDVEINYRKNQNIDSVTSNELDAIDSSQKSGADLAREIEQLLIDIQDLDANEYYVSACEAKEKGKSVDALSTDKRISRFKQAFNYMFNNQFSWGGITNLNGKQIYFMDKNKNQIMLSNLSSGEKQIVYRGAYLLKDSNSLRGATVLIDEPEISLHPEWQKKIMDYYKRIFTDENGIQTSQIFAVTHSPFIIHNENRYNDKVIILKKDYNGKIYIEDKPSYYDCNSVKVVEDAFNIQDFSTNIIPTVYVEGRTDEKYIKKAAEVYGLSLPFAIKWIGHMDANGQESNTGFTALNKAKEFLITQGNEVKTVLLYDCDTNKKDENSGNIYIRHLPKYKNSKNINKGIENALILDAVNLEQFYKKETKTGDYGEEKIIFEFQKMDCCDYICGLDDEILKAVFANIQTVLLNIISILGEDSK